MNDASDQCTFGSSLRALREAANLTQEELAGRSGLSVQAVGALERGERRSPRPSTVEVLAAALRIDDRQREAFIAAAQGRAAPAWSCGDRPQSAAGAATRVAEAQTLLESMPVDALPERTPLPTGSRMPLAPNPLFVGRGDELLHVARALRGGDTTVALGHVVASTGLGGLGKTQLAVEFVHRYARYFSGGVFWLSFTTADEIPLQIAACAAPEFEARPMEERLKVVTAAWLSTVPRLLVFDNCEEESLLDAWRPTSGGCRVLVTSRRSHWSPTLGVTALPLDLLPRSDSIELLRRYRPDLAAGDPRLDSIAGRLGDLPLALHLAGRYLLAYHAEVGLDEYLAELDQPDLIRHASLLGEGVDDSPSPTHHVENLAQTFALCLGRLDRDREVDQVAIALLARIAWMAPGEPVPRTLLAGTLDGVDARLRADGLRRLGAAGLVEQGDGWLRLHRLLVHFVRQEGLDPSAAPAVKRALIGYGEDASRGHLTRAAVAAVIPHLVDVAGRAAAGDPPLTAELSTAAGVTLQHAGDFRAARPWYERALAIRERVLGSDHPDTATSLNNLAWLLYQMQCDLAVARPLYERALAIRERLLGPDHPDTAQALNDLGVLLHEQGELAAARPLYERALAIRERVLGPDHPDTSEGLNNLAGLLFLEGELAAARPLYERALAIRERVLGRDHPKTALTLCSLGVVLHHAGELDVARPLLEHSLDIRERVLGPDHPETATSLNRLARLLHAKGDLAAARALYERALDIRERALGADHPRTAACLHNLARLLRDQHDPAAARPLFERALAIRERVLGDNHTDTVATRSALAEGSGAATGG